MLPRNNLRLWRWNLAFVSIAKKHQATRAIDNVVPVFRTRVKKVRLLDPVHPHFDDFLVLVATQPQLAAREFQLRALTGQHLFKLSNYISIVVSDLQRENPPFDIRARARKLAYFDPLSRKHRNLSKAHDLISHSGTQTEKRIVEG